MKRSRSYAVVLESIGPVVICLAAILLTSFVLVTIDGYLPNEHLMLGYLLPTIFVAIYFGSTIAVLTSFAGGLAAAYFLLPPRFSFYVADPIHIAELGFTVMLAVIASKVVGALAYDVRAQSSAPNPKFAHLCRRAVANFGFKKGH